MRLTDQPKALGEMTPDVAWPADVQAVMDKALERDATLRYQNGDGVRTRRCTARSSGCRRRRRRRWARQVMRQCRRRACRRRRPSRTGDRRRPRERRCRRRACRRAAPAVTAAPTAPPRRSCTVPVLARSRRRSCIAAAATIAIDRSERKGAIGGPVERRAGRRRSRAPRSPPTPCGSADDVAVRHDPTTAAQRRLPTRRPSAQLDGCADSAATIRRVARPSLAAKPTLTARTRQLGATLRAKSPQRQAVDTG